MTRKRIMVVEDEGITAMNIKSELEDMGYDVPSIAISGEEALEIAGQNNIDLVLMDIMLSGKIDGVEASGRIRSMLQIPIVYITANTDEKIMEQIKLTEPYGYICKPFSVHELRMAVELAFFKSSMEARLKESEHRFRTLFNQASDCILLLDPDREEGSIIVDANDAACQMHGYTREELIGKPIAFLDAPGQIDKSSDRFRKLIMGEMVSFELIHKRKNGDLFPVDVNAQLVTIGDKSYIQAIDRDITERKNVEMELKKHRKNLQQLVSERTHELKSANELLEKVFSNMHVLIAYMDPDFNLIKVNRKYAEADGRETGFYNGKNHFDLFPDKENEKIFRNVVKTGKPFFVQAKPLVRTNKPEVETTYWDWSLIPVLDDKRAVSGLVMSLIDVTENIRLYSDLIRSEQLASLGRLAAGVAHEVNNPINGIMNYAQMIASKSKPESMERDIAMRIINESDRISGIVSSLLSFARENRGEKASVSVSEILSDSLALSEIMLKKDKIEMICKIPDDLIIYANRQQIEQVFLNIISNARHALNRKYPEDNKDKVLKITGEKTVENDVSYARVVFYDKGTGVSESVMDKLMSPFFSTKPEGEGTGLGLSISHGIVTDHNGRIKIKSREGKFTKVIIDLPSAIND